MVNDNKLTITEDVFVKTCHVDVGSTFDMLGTNETSVELAMRTINIYIFKQI
jgi:hypothetical protein